MYCQLTAKTATGNGNLQPEIEINEYSSSKKITRVVYYSSIIRVLAAALLQTQSVTIEFTYDVGKEDCLRPSEHIGFDWLLSLNIIKCQVVTFGRSVDKSYKYTIRD